MRVGCLGCFVDSRLQIRNSSKRRARVFFLGFMLRILSWRKSVVRLGCLGCFVDSRLQIRNSSKRRAGVFFLGFMLCICRGVKTLRESGV